MNAIQYSAWFVCVLGGAVFSAAASRRWTAIAIFAAACAVGMVLMAQLQDSAWGLASAVAAGCLLWRPHRRWIAPLAAGFLTAGSGSAVGITGQPWSGWLLALVVCAVSYRAAKSPGFTSEHTQEEALFLILALGTVSAALPGIAGGWQSALALNVAPAGAPAVPLWVISAGGISIALGGVYSWWRRAQ